MRLPPLPCLLPALSLACCSSSTRMRFDPWLECCHVGDGGSFDWEHGEYCMHEWTILLY
ncbi:hypothetical protein BCV70DRAFT_203185 [Testicularia cyperi]|uniref:CBM1 domain-containing protein n=1 Tax=Testicularia cyperi TaxID=1882483 RepID=A0A317XF39_9BASI|nr:hypothetical protein BCV70DRAFT_203185 [Testicularia cyperi]